MSSADPPVEHDNAPANENDDHGQPVPLDPRVRANPRANGRQIARELARGGRPANDNGKGGIN